MNQEQDGGNQTHTSFQTSMSNSFNSNRTAKYGGMIERSVYRKIRDELLQLFDYVYSVSPAFTAVHIVITFFRIFQFCGPSLCPHNVDYWQSGTVENTVVSVISIFFHIIPPQYRLEGRIYFSYAFFAVELIMVVMLIGSARYFQKNAKLPGFLPPVIALYFASLVYVLHPIAVEYTFEMLSMVIWKRDAMSQTILIEMIVAMVLDVIACCFFFWVFIIIASQSLTFRPNSMMTVMPDPQNLAFMLTNMLGLPIGLGMALPTTGDIGAMIVAAILYFFCCSIPFWNGGFVNRLNNELWMSAAITGGVMSLVVSVSRAIGAKGSFIIIFGFVILFVICFIVCHIAFTRKIRSHLITLDGILDDPDAFSNIRSVNKMIALAVDGFAVAHPVCINWQFFKAAAERWPKEPNSWFIFAKFVAIYPEETLTLAWIFHAVITLKLHGTSAKTIKEQSLTISRQRESNLSPDLKTKLNSVQKKLQATKHKLRHVWDMVIQGNIGEMESATKRAFHETEQTDAEFKHLFRQFPNNRFVTRQYARFCKEVAADQDLYNEMIDKTRLLQRGITVNLDQAHELGLAAFHFLPDKIQGKADAQSFNATSTDSAILSTELTEGDDDQAAETDQTNALRQRIENLVIPSIKWTRVIRLLMLFCLFIIPGIAFLIYVIMFIKNITAPLAYLYQLAAIRTSNFQIVSWETRYVYEKFGVLLAPLVQASLPDYLGRTYDTKPQMEYIISTATVTIQKIEDFRKLETGSEKITKAQSLIFDSTLNYTFFTTESDHKDTNLSLQTAMMDYVGQASVILDMDTIPAGVVNQSYLQNPINNIQQIGEVITESLALLIEYIMENDTQTNMVSNAVMIAVCVISVVAFISALVVQVKWLQSSKEEVYKCLTALPKNVVSTLAENLRVLKKDADNQSSTCSDTEISKQEENILKIFMTGGNVSNTKLADRLLLIIGSLVTIVLEIVCVVLLCNLLVQESQTLKESAPHLNYINGAYANTLGALFGMFHYVFWDTPYWVPNYPRTYWNETIRTWLTNARDFFHAARYGGITIDEAPFYGFAEGLQLAYTKILCVDDYAIPNGIMEAIACYSADQLYVLMEAMMRPRLEQMVVGGVVFDLHTDRSFDQLWTILISPTYDGFFAPMFETITETIEEQLATQQNSVVPGIVVMIVLSLIMELIVLIQINNIDKHMKQVLGLLLHSPPQVVTLTPKIMRVLSGDFSAQKGDMTKRDAEFFDALFMNLPDAVMFVEMQNYTIQTVNKSCSRVFNVDGDSLIGRNIREFLNSPMFHGESKSLFDGQNATVDLAQRREDGTEVNVQISSMVINQKLVLTTRDTTQMVRYNTLIREERAKSDYLLASILPPSLVKRVQAGEQNISFAVQSATVVFMDIVSFTPWCGSLPADKVMSTLNLLFKKFDFRLSQYPTMTKIKCIGDCYMGAGGVFAETNQPTEHAKEVVAFGLDSLDAVRELDQELSEKLQIRVGVNTGGPIVAGVLGVGKPTFEILGPAINMAQQMEHHGVPMNVHVSRSVYELIYGDTFTIKERGSVEVKGGSVITYLVTGKTRPNA